MNQFFMMKIDVDSIAEIMDIKLEHVNQLKMVNSVLVIHQRKPKRKKILNIEILFKIHSILNQFIYGLYIGAIFIKIKIINIFLLNIIRVYIILTKTKNKIFTAFTQKISNKLFLKFDFTYYRYNNR